MDSSCSRVTSESTTTATSCDRKRVIVELNRGRQITDQLRAILQDDDDAITLMSSAGSLVQKILDSFANSISILITTADGDSDEVSQIPATMNSPARKSEANSGETHHRAPKDRRGCYKRRRTTETETRETSSLFEDGHAWRKYGQKVILNAKHPRNYFRCTHKFDQGCQATKQVQKIEDDPAPLFRTTYHSHHTCNNLININHSTILSHHQIIMDDAAAATQDDSSIIWSFDQSHKQDGDNDNDKNNYAPVVINNPAAVIVKKEGGQEVMMHQSNLLKPTSLITSNDDYNDFICPDDQFLTYDDDESIPLSAFSSGGSDNHGDGISSDVYSCSAASNHSTTMDMADIMSFGDLPEFKFS